MPPPVALSFSYASRELQNLLVQLAVAFPGNEALTKWLTAESARAASALPLTTRFLRLRSSRTGPQAEDKFAWKKRVGEFFVSADPRSFSSELSVVLALGGFSGRYEAFVAALCSDPMIGPLVRRYRLPSKVIERLSAMASAEAMNALKQPLSGLQQAFHAHADLMREMNRNKGLKMGAQFAAAIVGRMLLGPYGGRMVSAAMAGSTRAQINGSIARIASAWDEVEAAWNQARAQRELHVAHVVHSVLGGLLLRVDADLRALGYRIAELSVDPPLIIPALDDERRRQLDQWGIPTVHELQRLLSCGQLQQAAEGAARALASLLRDPVKARAVSSGATECWAVRFAAIEAEALSRLADRCWLDGDHATAARLYAAWIFDLPVLTEPACADATYRLGRAAWRMALVVAQRSSSAVEVAADSDSQQVRLILALAARCAASERIELPGRRIDLQSKVVGSVLAQYAKDCGLAGHTGAASSSPSGNSWPAYRARTFEGWAASDGLPESPLNVWLTARAAQERRRLAWGAFAGVASLAVVGCVVAISVVIGPPSEIVAGADAVPGESTTEPETTVPSQEYQASNLAFQANTETPSPVASAASSTATPPPDVAAASVGGAAPPEIVDSPTPSFETLASKGESADSTLAKGRRASRPTLSHTIPSGVMLGEPIVFNVEVGAVTDDCDVVLRYRYDDEWAARPMERAGDGTYDVRITAKPNMGSTLLYFIEAHCPNGTVSQGTRSAPLNRSIL